jgi:hypothetical protein
VRILEGYERVMRIRTLKYAQVLWSQQIECEATWELESCIWEKYLELFMAGMRCIVMFLHVIISVASSITRKNSGTNSV